MCIRDRLAIEKRILRLSFMGSVFFILAEGVMAWYTHSHSLWTDCLFDSADLVMIGPFMVLVPLLYKPVTEKHPYGYAQVESLFLLVKYSVLLALTCNLMVENIKLLFHGGHEVDAVSYTHLSDCDQKSYEELCRVERRIIELDMVRYFGHETDKEQLTELDDRKRSVENKLYAKAQPKVMGWLSADELIGRLPTDCLYIDYLQFVTDYEKPTEKNMRYAVLTVVKTEQEMCIRDRSSYRKKSKVYSI